MIQLTLCAPDTPEGLALQQTLFKGWQNLIDLPATTSTPSVKEFVDPNYPQPAYKLIREGVNSVLGKFGNLIPQGTKIYLIFSTTYDFEMGAIKSEPDMYQDWVSSSRLIPTF